MRLGVMVEGQDGLTWERWRRIASRVEELGFESLWRSDHFISLIDPARDSLETWVALMLTAAETTRIRFGPLVCPMTFRHPALLARMAAAVDALSGGRLELGLGAGWNEVEHAMFGIDFPPLPQRMAMLAEGIEVILRLFGDGPGTFTSNHYQLAGTTMLPKPRQRQRPPILIGGKGERYTLPVVARYADEWNLTGATPTEVRAKGERLTACCRAINRDPRTIRRSVMTGFIIGGSTAELEHRCRAMQRLFPELAALDADAVPAAVRCWGWITGTPDEIVQEIRALADADVDRLMLQHHDQDDDESLRLIAREVLPAFAG